MTDGPQTPESPIGVAPQKPDTTTASGNQIETNQEQTPKHPQEETAESPEPKETQLTNQVLITFLKKQKHPIPPIPEEKPLTPDQQEFNKKVDELINQFRLKPDQQITTETLIKALNLGYQINIPQQISQINSLIEEAKEKLKKPDISPEEKRGLEEKIDRLTELGQKKEELLKDQTEIPKELKKMIEEIFNQLAKNPELKANLITALNNGSFNEVMEVFVNEAVKEEEGDLEETKNLKKKVRETAVWIKNETPMIGGVAGLLLLLMILKASKSTGGEQGGMMGL